MKKDFLEDEGNVLKVQKHQLEQSEKKIVEIDNILSDMHSKQEDDDLALDKMMSNMEVLLDSTETTAELYSKDAIVDIEEQLSIEITHENITIVDELDKVNINDNMSWEAYISSVEEYGLKHNLHLEEDPFKSLMSKSQQIEVYKRIQEEFTLKNAQCDEYDYMIAGTCGVVGGLIDILFVGAPGDSKLGDITDTQANKITEKFAEFLGWDKNKIDYEKYSKKQLEKGKVPLDKDKYLSQRMTQFLEDKFKINYDQTHTNKLGKAGTGGKIKNLNPANHHLKSLGHSPDLIGLFFSILNQFTSTSTFISNGKIITIDTETFELQGNNFIAKVFCGFANWFGHIMSDWSGSNSSVAKGNRGSGVPIPFYNLLQMIDFGEFGEHKQTFATITTKVFEDGYDFRHGMAMAVPVLTTELLIRLMYTMKAHFYHKKDWKESLPNANIPELRRMLLIGHGALCLIDGTDAYIRSGGEMVTFLSRTNLLAWVRFGQLGLKELNAWYNAGHMDIGKVDEYLYQEYKRMLKKT